MISPQKRRHFIAGRKRDTCVFLFFFSVGRRHPLTATARAAASLARERNASSARDLSRLFKSRGFALTRVDMGGKVKVPNEVRPPVAVVYGLATPEKAIL